MSGWRIDEWHRLDARTTVAAGALLLGPMIPTIAIMLIGGARLETTLRVAGIWLVIGILLTAFSGLDWYLTRFRVTADRFELRKGGIFRSHRWVPRDRIRSVDLTATPIHRVLGLAVAKIGTGESAELKLESLGRPQAEALRQELLRATETTTVDSEAAEPDAGLIARLDPRWLAYGALTVSLVAIVWGAIASAFSSLQDVPFVATFLTDFVTQLHSVPLWLIVAGSVLGTVLTGMLGALALSVEMWWGFRLTRENDVTLRVRRGLLTTRSVSLEERRLRGVELAEPLVLRWAGGARTNAVATGLNASGDKRSGGNQALLPPAPRAEAERVAAAALRATRTPTGTELTAHPRVALRRRLVRGLAVAVPVAVALVIATVIGWLPLWLTCLGIVLVLAICGYAALLAYRSLGHALDARYLIARRGWAVRRTVALQRGGIIGWRIRQSIFQRRANILTLGATTAAGHGVYEVADVGTDAGLRLADEAVPELLAPFLERG